MGQSDREAPRFTQLLIATFLLRVQQFPVVRVIVSNENRQKQELTDAGTIHRYRQVHPLAQPVHHRLGAHGGRVQAAYVARAHQRIDRHIVDVAFAPNRHVHVMDDEGVIGEPRSLAQASMDAVQAAQMRLPLCQN